LLRGLPIRGAGSTETKAWQNAAYELKESRMFELARTYTFTMYKGPVADGATETLVTVVDYNHPLVKVEHGTGGIQVINTASPAFISATLRIAQV
jgi:hypothetical protein